MGRCPHSPDLLWIGLGELESGGRGAEERYRAIEKDPPTGACPMNWVYVGTVQREYVPKSCGKPIPVSAFDFRLADSDYPVGWVRRHLERMGKYIPKCVGRFCKEPKRL